MCGIAGLYTIQNHAPEYALIQAMCDIIEHRGPDEEGIHCEPHIGLGNRRLSIIDLATGQQPIHNEDKTIWTVFNGEIYNYRALKSELQDKGHTFYTEVDTEVIVHLYEEYGAQFVTKLNGMFAIAVWDRNQQLLTIARDRLGIKPLSYYTDGKTLVFGSEIKSLLTSRFFAPQLNLDALDQYLAHGYIPSPDSIFQGVHKLPPGHLLQCQNGNLSITEYWDVSLQTQEKLQAGNTKEVDEAEYEERLQDLLRQAVQRRLMSDVPLGAFLSGGVDSSVIVGIMSQLMDQPVQTFSIGFEEPDFNELSDAKRVAQHFQTNHTELIVRPNAVELLPELVQMYDEPIADSSTIATYYVSKLAREHVTVALSGDGGDELFAGYPRYVDDRKDAILSRLPQSLKLLLASAGEQLPTSLRVKKYLRYLTKSDTQRYIQRAGVFPLDMREGLYTQELRHKLQLPAAYALFEHCLEKKANASLLEKMLYLDLKTYLPHDILFKVDIASMVNSLEVRVPFLDHEFVEFVTGMPLHLKIRDNEQKYLLKKLLSKYVPHNIWDKEKRGFGIPLKHWLRKDLKDYSTDLLTSQRARERGLFPQRIFRPY